jgi:ABC-type bacteriocin/lantibiotic exporter with double-glycine peptidase domain
MFLEMGFALSSGLIVAFIYNWKMALVGIAVVPFVLVGGAINAKLMQGGFGIDSVLINKA